MAEPLRHRQTKEAATGYHSRGPPFDALADLATELIRDTINHYGPVFIASLSIQIRRAGVQKNSAVLGVVSRHYRFSKRLHQR